MNNSLDDYIAAYGEGFDYAFDNNIILDWYPRRIVELCPDGSSLLELGLGHGLTTSRFSRHFSRHLVLDGSASVIEQFRHQFPGSTAEIMETYFENFETAERFDVIVMGFILEHVDDPALILRKFRGFLKPGGRCFVAVPNAESLHRRFGHAAGLLEDMQALGKGDRELGHVRLYSVESLDRQLEEAGYRPVRREGVFLKPFTTSQLQSLALGPDILKAMCAVGIGYPELSCALLVEAAVAR
jgi:SAM-dependent methyltransferase